MDLLELQKRILRYLSELKDEERPLESMDLAARWGLTGDEVLTACDGLVSQGLVQKESYRSSSNNIVLHQLTDEGKKFVRDEWRRKK